MKTYQLTDEQVNFLIGHLKIVKEVADITDEADIILMADSIITSLGGQSELDR